MDWQLGSAIGMYVVTVVFVIFTHLCASAMDEVLYKHNKYNGSRKTMRIGLRWLFWRGKKEDEKEIFKIAFVHEVINVILFIAMIVIFVMSLITKDDWILLVGFCLIIVYVAYCIIMEKRIRRKYKEPQW